MSTRNERQHEIAAWVARTFGPEHMSVEHRGVRFLEEAIELYQAAGCSPEMAHKLVDFIFARKPGKIQQEIGGVGTTLCAIAQAAGFYADDEEARELARVLAKPREHFRERDENKSAAGFKVETGAGPNNGGTLVVENCVFHGNELAYNDPLKRPEGAGAHVCGCAEPLRAANDVCGRCGGWPIVADAVKGARDVSGT